MSVFIKGLNIKPCKDGFNGKGLVIIGYDDKLYVVAHEQIIPLPDHGDLIDRDKLKATDSWEWIKNDAPVVIPAERSEECPKQENTTP